MSETVKQKVRLINITQTAKSEMDGTTYEERAVVDPPADCVSVLLSSLFVIGPVILWSFD
jgi:hypothetical protein